MTALLAGILIGIVGRDLWPSVRRRGDMNAPGTHDPEGAPPRRRLKG